MNWQSYKNELIVLVAFLVLLMGYGYKHRVINTQANSGTAMEKTISQIKDILELKDIWVDKKLNSRLAKLQSYFPPSKVRWRKKGKKIEASFKGLTARELNILISKIMNLSLVIRKLTIHKRALIYDVEFKCKF